MKLHIRESELRAYLRRKSLSESIFEEIKALDSGDKTEAERVKLSDLNPGERFKFGGYEWVKLGDNGEASLCLSAEIVTNKAFDENNCNDWRGSTLREWLNKDFLQELCDNETHASGGDTAENEPLRKIVSDLTADDGMTDYGTAEDYIALLTCDLYRKYRGVIPAIDEWYWTLTPCTCRAANSCLVLGVNTDGTLNDYLAYCFGNDGVRPLCNLGSSILVSKTEVTENE